MRKKKRRGTFRNRPECRKIHQFTAGPASNLTFEFVQMVNSSLVQKALCWYSQTKFLSRDSEEAGGQITSKDASNKSNLRGSMKKVLIFGISLISLSCCFIISLFSCSVPEIKRKIVPFYKDSYNSSRNGSVKVKNINFHQQSYLINWNGINFSNHHELESVFRKGADITKYKLLLQQNVRPLRRLPDSLIIGVKKGGTRALLQFIRMHPNVRAASFEIHFFDRNYRLGEQWYRRRMPPTIEGQITLEKTPSYFVTQSVPARVRHMNQFTKLLVVVRDPVTRVISDYAQAASKKTNPTIRKFEELAFVNGSEHIDANWGPIKIGMYANHLTLWLKYFPLSQLLFVSGERLIVDPAAEMTRVQEFLDLKSIINEKYFYFNATKGFPCLMKSEGHSKPTVWENRKAGATR